MDTMVDIQEIVEQGYRGEIEMDEATLSGVPRLTGRRISVADILRMVVGQMTEENYQDIYEQWGVTENEIGAVERFCCRLGEESS